MSKSTKHYVQSNISRSSCHGMSLKNKRKAGACLLAPSPYKNICHGMPLEKKQDQRSSGKKTSRDNNYHNYPHNNKINYNYSRAGQLGVSRLFHSAYFHSPRNCHVQCYFVTKCFKYISKLDFLAYFLLQALKSSFIPVTQTLVQGKLFRPKHKDMGER